MLLPDPEHPEKQPPSAPTYLLDMIKEKDQIIRQQAEELGELREKLKNAQAGKTRLRTTMPRLRSKLLPDVLL